MPNEKLDKDVGKYLINTYDAEQLIGGRFWDRISGSDIHDLKRVKNRMWALS